MWGIETVGIETVGIETDGKLDGSQPDTLPVTFENIPPDAFVGLKRMEFSSIKCPLRVVCNHHLNIQLSSFAFRPFSFELYAQL